jgi:hypothetical protein
MAQQLMDAQESIGLLAMVDSICIRLVKSALTELPLISEPSGPKRNFFIRARHTFLCRIGDAYKMANCAKYRMIGRPIPHELRYWRVEQKNIAISTAYLPKPYEGLITMFRATLNTECSDPNRGWATVAKGGMQFFDFVCHHEETIEQSVFKQKLNEILQKETAAHSHDFNG